MGKLIATVFFALLIWQIYRWTRDDEDPTSTALWLPTFWLFIGSSRNVSEWLHMSSGGAERYTEGSPLDRIVLTVAIALGLIVLTKRAPAVRQLLGSNIPILMYFAYCLISVLWSDFPLVAAKRWFRASGDIIMILIVLTDPSWVSAVKRVLTRLGILLIPLSILFSRWYPQFGRQFSHAGEPYWSGVTEEKNALGSICMVYGLAFIYYSLQIYRHDHGPRRKARLVGHGIVIGMAVYLLIQSRSATALASFVLAAIPMILTFRYRAARKPVIVHAMVWGALGTAACVLFLGVGSGMLTDMGRNSTLTGRTAVWQAALSLAESPMVGTGFESFWLGARYNRMAELTGMYLNQAHNGFLETYINLGWIGVILLSLILLTGYNRLVKSIDRMASAASLGLAFFMVTISVNFTEASFGMAGPIWMCFLMTTMALPIALRSGELVPSAFDSDKGVEADEREKRPRIPTLVRRRVARSDLRKLPEPTRR